MPNPWEEDWSQPQQAQPVRVGSVDPFKVRNDARDDTRLNLAVEAARRANENSEASNSLAERRFQYQQQQDSIKPKTKAMRQGDGDKLEAEVSQYASLTDALASFNPEFGGNTITGGAENTLQSLSDWFGTPGQRDWWANFSNTDNIIRNGLYGASLTAGEKAAYDATTVTPRMAPEQIKANLARRADIVQAALGRKVNRFRAAGFNADEIDATIGLYGDDFTPQALEQNRFFNPNAPRDAEQRRFMEQDDQQPVAGAFGAQNPPTGGGAGGGGVQGSPILTVDGRGGGQSVARGSTRVQDNPVLAGVNSRVNAMLKGGKSTGEVMSYLASVGAPIDPGLQANIQRAVEWRKKNPSSPANHYVNIDDQVIPVSGFDQGINNVVASPGGTAFVNGVNASTAGFLANTMGERAKAGLGAINAENPKSAIGGQVVGGIAGTLGAGKILGAASRAVGGGRLGATLANPLTADAAYGATYGANMANDGERLQGAATGVLASLAGNAAGRYGVAPVARNVAQSGFGQSVARGGNTVANGFRSMLGKNPVAAPLPIPQVSPERQTILNAISGDNARQIVPMLRDAADLGLPMTLADTDAGLRSLAGAAVRRSPNAKTLAESSLGERSRGQADRLVSALDRDFMPGANIPQRSQDLIEQAKATSAPLYQQAMSNPGASSVPIDDILSTPMGQEALRRAYLEAENAKALGGQGAKAQGFDLNDQAEPFITSVPSFDTLDMMKRGFDDIVNEARDPVTGTVNMNAGQTAANAMRRSLIARMDKVNPDYASARAAYAGPAGEREALNMGAKAYSTTPDQIRMATGGMSPGKLDQYRLGYRGALDNVVDRTRLSGNPYEAVYGTPGAREKASLLFPTQEGVSRFGRQYDLERQMAQTNNQVLGNSMTAERQLADQSFDVSPGAALAIDGATMMTTGTPPIATGLSLMSRFGKDALKLGVGKKKADALAPLLLNPDASYAAKMFDETMTDARVARYIKSAGTRKAKRKGGLFGSALATPIAVEANR